MIILDYFERKTIEILVGPMEIESRPAWVYCDWGMVDQFGLWHPVHLATGFCVVFGFKEIEKTAEYVMEIQKVRNDWNTLDLQQEWETTLAIFNIGMKLGANAGALRRLTMAKHPRIRLNGYEA